jgi:HEPN domain-containing protein
MKPHLEEAQRSLKVADRDMAAFRVLAASTVVHPSIVGFHAQQAVEKCLKAVLFSRQVEFERIHDLIRLAVILERAGLRLPVSEQEMSRLNPFAVTFRYDDLEIGQFSLGEVERVLETVRNWAESEVSAAEAAFSPEPSS